MGYDKRFPGKAQPVGRHDQPRPDLGRRLGGIPQALAIRGHGHHPAAVVGIAGGDQNFRIRDKLNRWSAHRVKVPHDAIAAIEVVEIQRPFVSLAAKSLHEVLQS